MSNWHQCFTYDPSPYCFQAPNKPGVYAIFLLNYRKWRKRLLYIGSSSNLRKRLTRHHPLLCRDTKLPYLTIAFARETNEYSLLEKKLIKKLQPILNRTFK
jgi:excinuclease UvrABC nuclease subunit